MRFGLLLSLIVHGVAAAALVLWGPTSAGDPPELGSPLAVSMVTDERPDPEPTRDDDVAVEGPPRPAESWPLPAEAEPAPEVPVPEEFAAPGIAGDVVRPVVRLSRPLRRTARAAPDAPPTAVAAAPPRAGAIHEPRLLRDSPRARYPDRARRLGLEGTVVLLLRVAADGAVMRVEVVTSSGHAILDLAAEEAAASWRFEPARRDGKAIAYDVRVPVEFRLTDA